MSRQQDRPSVNNRAQTQRGQRSQRDYQNLGRAARTDLRDASYYRDKSHYLARKQTSKVPFVAVCVVALVILGFIVAFANGAFSGPSAKNITEEATTNSLANGGGQSGVSTAVLEADNVVMAVWGSVETYTLKGEEYIESGCNATELGIGNISDSVVVSGNVDVTKVGDYIISYTAITSEGKVAYATRVVHVVDAFESGSATSVPTLMYHYVYNANDVPQDLNSNYILDTALAEQCEYLKQNNFYFPSYQELRAFVDGTHSVPANSVVMTFDDGNPYFVKYGIPVLNQYGVPATSFIEGIYDQEAGISKTCASQYVQFQSHSYYMHHGYSGVGQGGIIHSMTEAEIYDDCISAAEVIGPIYAMAYPFGDNNENAWTALEDAGVLCAFTVENDRDYIGDNPYALNRVRILGSTSLDSFAYLVSPR